MRVLIILKYIPSAGHHQKSDLLRTTIDAHLNEGHEVVLLTTGNSDNHQWEEIKVSWGFLKKAWSVVSRRYLKNFLGISLNSEVAKKVARYHEKKPVDLIFADCTNYQPAVQAYKIKQLTYIPYVVREHKNYERLFKSTDDIKESYLKSLRGADALVAVSPLLATIIKDLGVRKDIACLPNALSDEFFVPPSTSGKYRKWAGKEFLFAGWTRWRDFKRVDLLLKAFAKIIDYGCQAKLVIAGPVEPDDNEKWVKEFIKEKGLAVQVWLTGEVPRDDIYQLAYDCDCCVVPSDYETFGLPALESLAAGKPAVVTKCNGPEFVVNNENLGRCVERGSEDDLFKGMLEIYENRDQFDRDALKKSAYERFSRTAAGKKFTELYEQLLNNPGKHNDKLEV